MRKSILTNMLEYSPERLSSKSDPQETPARISRSKIPCSSTYYALSRVDCYLCVDCGYSLSSRTKKWTFDLNIDKYPVSPRGAPGPFVGSCDLPQDPWRTPSLWRVRRAAGKAL